MLKKTSTKDENIYYTQIFSEKEQLEADDINLKRNINNSLLEKIKEKWEGKCSKLGYVQKGSVKIVERSIGRVDSSHFSGNVIFDLKIETKICNPTEGDIIRCKVIGINKMGIMCSKEPLLICLSKLHHQDKDIIDDYGKIKVHQTIDVEVICSKFELYDTEINVIAKLANK